MGGSSGEMVRSQNNIGSGLFVGGDNRGSISFQMVDAQTKAWLAKTAKVAPDLARLLGKALSDGIISPDTVDALTIAALNINADVADALIIAGRHINAEVADTLSYAGQNINTEVAETIRDSADKLTEERQALEQLLNSVNYPATQFQKRAYHNESATPASAIYVDANPRDYPWKAKLKIFGWGSPRRASALLATPLSHDIQVERSMEAGAQDRQAARNLAALAQAHVARTSRGRLRRALLWITRGRLGQQHDWPNIPIVGTPWQDNASVRGMRWRERAAYIDGRPVFGVDYQVCRYCRAGWVEEPYTEDKYKRCGLAAAGLAALRAEHPGFTWHTAGNHMPDSEQFWQAVGAEVPGGYQQRDVCVHRTPKPASGNMPKVPGVTAPMRRIRF